MRTLLAALFSTLLSLPVFPMALKDVSPGKTVSGPSLTVNDMKGKVVIAMYWGVKCPLCLAEMPKLGELFKKYEADGLHIIGLEAQQSADDITKSTASGRGGIYQITTGGRIEGTTGGALPQGYLFDAAGNMVDDKVHVSPEFEAKLKELLKDVAGNRAGPGPYKKLAPVVSQLRAGLPPGMALKSVASKLKSKDADEAAEAKAMTDALRASGNATIVQALSKTKDDPAGTVARLDKVAQQYAGDEVGLKAKGESDALKKDPEMKKELEADAFLKKILAIGDTLKPVRGLKNPKDDAFRKQNLPAISSMLAGCAQLTQKYAGTKAASAAQDVIDEYR